MTLSERGRGVMSFCKLNLVARDLILGCLFMTEDYLSTY